MFSGHHIAFITAIAAGMFVPAMPLDAQQRHLDAGLVRRDTEREWTLKATKLRTVLQPLMRKHSVDMWIIMSRENGPDPALELFGGNGITGWYGHRNAYIFYDPGGSRPLQTVAIGDSLGSPPRVVLSNSFAFGGANAALLFGRE